MTKPTVIGDPSFDRTVAVRALTLKLKLSALRDSYVSDFLPGAPSIADEACDMLDELTARLGLEPLHAFPFRQVGPNDAR